MEYGISAVMVVVVAGRVFVLLVIYKCFCLLQTVAQRLGAGTSRRVP